MRFVLPGWMAGGSWVRAAVSFVRLAGVLVLGALPSAARPPTDYEVKAAFLLNFARFVDWPGAAHQAPNSPLVIGLVGEDPFGPVLPQLTAGETAQGRRIEIRRLREDEPAQGCHVIFLGRSLEERIEQQLARYAGQPVLTVSDAGDFAARGGMVGFVVVRNSVRFEINPVAANREGLKVSSKLLAVARKVVRAP
jgi:hypothetical protein